MRHGIWPLIKRTFEQWSEDRVSRLAASLAYYTVFSIPPVLVICIAVAGTMFGQENARKEVADQAKVLIGDSAAAAMSSILSKASAPGSGGVTATIIGIIVLIYGATNVFAELQDSMNVIWEVQPRPGKIWWELLRDRLLSFVMVMGTAFLLLVSLVASAILAAINRHIAGPGEGFWRVVNVGTSLVVFAGLFAATFKWVPDVKIRWRDVWIGAIVTSILFNLGKYLIGLYLGHGAVTSVYGAAGSLAVLLIWVYYSAQILYLGAEFTQVYAKASGEPIEPARGAMEMPEIQRQQQGMPRKKDSA